MARRVKGEASRQSGEPDRHVNGEPDGQAAAALELQAGRHPWDAAVARTVAPRPTNAEDPTVARS